VHPRNGREPSNTIYSEAQVENALTKSGVRIVSEIGTHFIVFCEYHNNYHTASAEVDKESGLFYCFSCQSTTDLPHLVMKASGMSYFEALRLIGEEDYDIAALVAKNTEDREIESFDQGIIDRLHSSVWGVGSEYFHTRHINDASIIRFELGYSDKQAMVTVPVHSPEGTLWGFVGRSIEGKRFKNNRGLNKSLTLFNLHRVWTSPRVFVVESSFDAIRLDQVGIPAVATLGAGISNEQIELLRRSFDDIVIIPDNDDAGESMYRKMLKLIPYAQVLPLSGVKDVGELSDDDLTSLV
jgi:DNA primase